LKSFVFLATVVPRAFEKETGKHGDREIGKQGNTEKGRQGRRGEK